MTTSIVLQFGAFRRQVAALGAFIFVYLFLAFFLLAPNMFCSGAPTSVMADNANTPSLTREISR